MGQHTNFRSILEHSGKNWTFVVHTNFQVEISDDTRIFSRRTQNLFWSKNQLSDKISQTFFPTWRKWHGEVKVWRISLSQKRKIHLWHKSDWRQNHFIFDAQLRWSKSRLAILNGTWKTRSFKISVTKCLSEQRFTQKKGGQPIFQRQTKLMVNKSSYVTKLWSNISQRKDSRNKKQKRQATLEKISGQQKFLFNKSFFQKILWLSNLFDVRRSIGATSH